MFTREPHFCNRRFSCTSTFIQPAPPRPHQQPELPWRQPPFSLLYRCRSVSLFLGAGSTSLIGWPGPDLCNRALIPFVGLLDVVGLVGRSGLDDLVWVGWSRDGQRLSERCTFVQLGGGGVNDWQKIRIIRPFHNIPHHTTPHMPRDTPDRGFDTPVCV